MIVAITGHRPNRARDFEVRAFYGHCFDKTRPDKVITGMADGVDLWAADEALKRDIPLIAAIPWSTHFDNSKFPDLYTKIYEAAESHEFIVDAEKCLGPWVYQKRNEWMVDHCTHLIGFYDGSRGGTENCIAYAAGKVPVKLYNPKTAEIYYIGV